ncbi:primase zinc finger, partial [Opisthorchis viverrini]
MIPNPLSDKRKRRPVFVQLTEDEIQNFLARSDGEKDSSGSDWDDVGETDMATFFASLSEKQTSPKRRKLSPRVSECTSTSKDPCPSQSLQTEARQNKGVLQDVGIDALFNASVSKAEGNTEVPELDVHDLFGSSSSDSDADGDILDGCDDEQDVSLSECGARIQKSLSVARRKQKEAEIEQQVERAIVQTSVDACQTPSTSLSGSKGPISVSASLAACAARRQKALSDLNNAQLRTDRRRSSLPDNHPPVTPHNSEKKSVVSSAPDYWLAVPTKLRVYRSKVSSELWANRTSDRQVYGLLQFIQHQRSQVTLSMPSSKRQSSTDSLVVVGVIGSKTPPRRSKNDRIYSIWHLSDLDQVGPGSHIGCVKLFLFGDAHEKLWKEPDGSVVAILGPRLMSDPSTSFNDKDVGITPPSPQHVMVLGQSPDYGICAALNKSGQSCFHVINKSVCRYCDLHVKKAYYEASSSRPGFFDSSHPALKKRPTNRYKGDRPPVNEPGVYSLPTSKMFNPVSPSRSESRVKLTVAKLSAAGYTVDSSVGLATQQHRVDGAGDPSQPPPSQPLSSPERKLVKALHRPTAGSMNLLRHLERSTQLLEVKNTSVNSRSQDPGTSCSMETQSHSHVCRPSADPKVGFTFSDFFAARSKKQAVKLTNDLRPGDFIDLGPVSTSQTPMSPILSGARLRASQLVKAKGGLKAMEARAKQRSEVSIKASLGEQSADRHRPSPLSQILDNNSLGSSAAKPVSSSNPPSLDAHPNGTENEPPEMSAAAARKNRLAELAKKVREGSSHTGLIAEAEINSEQARMAVLEKRDEFEQKLTGKTEEQCTYVCCKTCNYRAWKLSDDCRKSNHSVVYLKGLKRYFKCKNCLKRTVTFERYPTVAC